MPVEFKAMNDTTRLILTVLVGAVLFGLAVYGLEIAGNNAVGVIDAAPTHADDI
jgi:hypothetical protein